MKLTPAVTRPGSPALADFVLQQRDMRRRSAEADHAEFQKQRGEFKQAGGKRGGTFARFRFWIHNAETPLLNPTAAEA